MSYQWYSVATCTTQIVGATGSTYTVPAQNDGTGFVYSYSATDSQGLSACATATITWANVAPAQPIITKPLS